MGSSILKKKNCSRHKVKKKKSVRLISPRADKRIVQLYRQKINEKLSDKNNAKKAAIIISEMIKRNKEK